MCAASTILVTKVPPKSIDLDSQTWNRTSDQYKTRIGGTCYYWVYDKGTEFPHFTIDLSLAAPLEVLDVHYKTSATEKIQLNDTYRDPAKFKNGQKTAISSDESKLMSDFLKAIGISIWTTPATKRKAATFSMTLSEG